MKIIIIIIIIIIITIKKWCALCVTAKLNKGWTLEMLDAKTTERTMCVLVCVCEMCEVLIFTRAKFEKMRFFWTKEKSGQKREQHTENEQMRGRPKWWSAHQLTKKSMLADWIALSFCLLHRPVTGWFLCFANYERKARVHQTFVRNRPF